MASTSDAPTTGSRPAKGIEARKVEGWPEIAVMATAVISVMIRPKRMPVTA